MKINCLYRSPLSHSFVAAIISVPVGFTLDSIWGTKFQWLIGEILRSPVLLAEVALAIWIFACGLSWVTGSIFRFCLHFFGMQSKEFEKTERIIIYIILVIFLLWLLTTKSLIYQLTR